MSAEPRSVASSISYSEAPLGQGGAASERVDVDLGGDAVGDEHVGHRGPGGERLGEQRRALDDERPPRRPRRALPRQTGEAGDTVVAGREGAQR